MEQVDEIKSKVDIVELVGEYVSLKKAGRNYKANCPFHGEKTPSFMVNPELQIFKCFGCGEGGDVYSFLQKIEGMNFSESLKYLADRVGVKLVSYKPSKQEEEKERLLKINKLVKEAYQYLLIEHKIGKNALEYILGRGVTKESIKKFCLGYAPNDWNFLTSFVVRKKGYKISDLINLGLLVPGKNYDRFRNRLMFPLNNSRGEPVGFAGRTLPGADEKAGGKYINTPETEVYHKSELLYGFDITRSEIKSVGYAVVVEGELDAICSFQAGIKNVVAIKGSAFTDKQAELLRRVTDEIVLALDADIAGNMAARRGIEIAQKLGLSIFTVNWNLVGEGTKDAADLATGNPELLKDLVSKKRISIYSFYIDSAIKKFGKTPEAKSKVIKDVMTLLKSNPHENEIYDYLKELGEKIETPIDILKKEMEKSLGVNSVSVSGKNNSVQKTLRRRDLLEQYIVGLAMRNEQTILLKKVENLFEVDFWRKVIDRVQKSEFPIPTKDFIKKLPDELREKAQELMLMEDERDMNFDKEWKKAVGELEELRIREKIPLVSGRELLKMTKRLAELTKGL